MTIAASITSNEPPVVPAPRRRFKPREAKKETFTIREGIDVDEIDSTRSWMNAQVPYENLADDEELGQVVVKFVNDHERYYQDTTIRVRNRWRVLHHILNGNSTASVWSLEEIHVPELHIALETLVPRLEEAMRQHDPWFAVVPTVPGKESEAKAQLLTAHLMSQLRMMKDDQEVQPAIRDLLIHQFCMQKIWWDVQEGWAVDRTVSRSIGEDGTISYNVVREEKKKVLYNAPRLRTIDPFDAVLDVRINDPQHMIVIGDNCWMTLDELEQMQDMKVFKNIDKVRELRPSEDERTSHQEIGHDKLSRSLTEQYRRARFDPTGTPRRYRVREVWCRSDILGDERRMLFSVVEGRVPVRVQENFHDNKMVPYAIGRVQRNGHEFFGTGIFDHAIPAQEQIDIHRGLTLEGAKNAACPPLITDADADFPESLFGLYPGAVFQGSFNKADFLRVPDVQQSAAYIEDRLRRDIEEITAALRVFTGGEQAGELATNTVRKIEEGNRRLRGIIRGLTYFEEEKLRIIHDLNGQFLTQSQTFQVLGKLGHHLGNYAEVSPDHYQGDVDFSFEGPSNLHTFGLRATAIAQLMTMAAPYANMYPDAIDVVAMLARMEELTLGRHQGNEIIRVPRQLDTLLSPADENLIMLEGKKVRVEEEDNHEDHSKGHFPLLQHAKESKNDALFKLVVEHMIEHSRRQQQEDARKSAMAGRVPRAFPPSGEAQVEPSPSGDLGFGGGVESTPRNENPGSADPAKVAKPGRSTPMNQDVNRVSA